MHIMTEALGMALPGTTPVRAGSDRMFENARQAARRVMDLIADDIRPRDILNSCRISKRREGSLCRGRIRQLCSAFDRDGNRGQCDIDILDAFRTVGNRVPLLFGGLMAPIELRNLTPSVALVQ